MLPVHELSAVNGHCLRFKCRATDLVKGCAISPDGSFIVSASWDQMLKVWDAHTGTQRFTLSGHADSVNGCAVSPDGSFIVSASDDRTLKVTARVGGIRFPDGIAYAPDVDKVFVSDESGDADVVIDASTGAKRSTIPLGGETGNLHFVPRTLS